MERRRYQSFFADNIRWDRLELRIGDVIVSPPAKCGTTWMQMLCALLILRTPALPMPLAKLSPWLEMQLRPVDDVVADLDAQSHRRFIKSHTPLDGLPRDPRLTYITVARDPRDVALSFTNHRANMDFDRVFEGRVAAVGRDDLESIGFRGPPPPREPMHQFWGWMDPGSASDDPDRGLPDMVHHLETFWEHRAEPNVHLFHYSDLRRDLAGEMTRLAGILGVEPPDEQLVEAASFTAMRARADELAPNVDTPYWRDNARFFDRGRSGEWRSVLDEAGQRRYEALIARSGPPDLMSFLHDGYLGAS